MPICWTKSGLSPAGITHDQTFAGAAGGSELQALSAKHRWKLAVAHFNHGLRGRTADADERFVAGSARKLGLVYKSERADVKAFALKYPLPSDN